MKKLASITLFAICALLAQNVSAQAIFLGNTIEVQTDGGFYTQLPVNCGLRTARRYLRKDSDSDLWCDSTVEGFCANRPVIAAEIVCSRRYFAALQKHKRQAQNADLNANTADTEPQESTTSIASSSSANSKQTETLTNSAEPTSIAGLKPTQPTLDPLDSTTPETADRFKQKSQLELLRELHSVEQELLDIQSATLTLRERDLELMRQQLKEKQ